jgi:hypothetical protein
MIQKRRKRRKRVVNSQVTMEANPNALLKKAMKMKAYPAIKIGAPKKINLVKMILPMILMRMKKIMKTIMVPKDQRSSFKKINLC